MKNFNLYYLKLMAFFALFFYSLTSFSSESPDDFTDISSVIQLYLDGTKLGEPALVNKAFLPTLEIQWINNKGDFSRRKAKDYISNIRKGTFVPRYGHIVSMDVTNNIAQAKVEIDWNKKRYTDYILLIKVEGMWRISNKVATWTEKN